ncbi:hypothetical protein FLCH110379_00390 [Flavobacterium chungbukense]
MMGADFGTFWHLMAHYDISREDLLDFVGHITKNLKNYEFKHSNYKNLPILQ